MHLCFLIGNAPNVGKNTVFNKRKSYQKAGGCPGRGLPGIFKKLLLNIIKLFCGAKSNKPRY